MVSIKEEYPVISDAVRKISQRFTGGDVKIAKTFEHCIRDTIQKTIHILEDGSVFVITGDIPAMWLRDSACQLTPFIRFAKDDGDILELLTALSNKQVEQILQDPYANAFQAVEDPDSPWMKDETDMKPILWERKYETDSLTHPILRHRKLWKLSGSAAHFTEDWRKAARLMIDLFRTEQDHEANSGYRFQRADCVFTDTLSRDGKGALVKGGTGLIWSGFRPSDDACVYGYNIPENMQAAVALEHIAEIAQTVYNDTGLSAQAADLAREVRGAVAQYGFVPQQDYYAYEVDGYGQYLVMDDANMPSLLAMPWFGWCGKDDPSYLATRKAILSSLNPYYYTGKAISGIGSPHTPCDYVWDIAIAVQGLTSTSREEQLECIRTMAENDAGTMQMHEGIHADDPERYTRPWFSWANSMFCELVLEYCGI